MLIRDVFSELIYFSFESFSEPERFNDLFGKTQFVRELGGKEWSLLSSS